MHTTKFICEVDSFEKAWCGGNLEFISIELNLSDVVGINEWSLQTYIIIYGYICIGPSWFERIKISDHELLSSLANE